MRTRAFVVSALIEDQKRGGVVPVVEPIVPFGVIVLEFGVMVEEFGVIVLGVVERVRERDRDCDRDERVVLVDGVLMVESVVVAVDVLGVV